MEKVDEKRDISVVWGQGSTEKISATLVGEIALREKPPTPEQVDRAMKRPLKGGFGKKLLGIALILFSFASVPSLFVKDWFFPVATWIEDAKPWIEIGRIRFGLVENVVIPLLIIPFGIGLWLLFPRISRRNKNADVFSDLWPFCYFYQRPYKSSGAGTDFSKILSYYMAYVLDRKMLLSREEVQKKVSKALPYKEFSLSRAEVDKLLTTLESAVQKGLGANPQERYDYAAHNDGTTEITPAGENTHLVEGSIMVLQKGDKGAKLLRLKISFYAVKRRKRIMPVHPVQWLHRVSDHSSVNK